jgi:hypothetical protein
MKEPVLERVLSHPIWPIPGVKHGEIIQTLIVVTMVLLDFDYIFIIQKRNFLLFY